MLAHSRDRDVNYHGKNQHFAASAVPSMNGDSASSHHQSRQQLFKSTESTEVKVTSYSRQPPLIQTERSMGKELGLGPFNVALLDTGPCWTISE